MSNQAQGLVRGLDMKAPHKPILMAYANYADDLGYVWAGVETIAFDTGYGVTAVKESRRKLIADGWMATKRRFGKSSIVRLNLDLMSHKQVDRGEHWKVRHELEFDNETAGQEQSAASRPTIKPQVRNSQPPRGSQSAASRPAVSRHAAVQSAASRPLSVSDPSVESPDPEDGRTEPSRQEDKTGHADTAQAIVAGLDLSKMQPYPKQVRQLRDLVAEALAKGYDSKALTVYAQAKVVEGSKMVYLLRAFSSEHLTSEALSRFATARPVKVYVPEWCGQCDPVGEDVPGARMIDNGDGSVSQCPDCHPTRATARGEAR